MSERALGPIHWLYGLSDYLEYVEEHDAKKFVDFIIKLSYADNPIFRLQETGSIHEFIFWLHKFTGHVEMLKLIQKYVKDGYDTNVLPDLFSRGQVQSKIWLATELANITKNVGNVIILGGWFGQLVEYIERKEILSNKIRIVDLDRISCTTSDNVFNNSRINEWRVKAVNCDLNDLVLDNKGYELWVENFKNEDSPFLEKFLPDLIINTSAEHMTDDWFFKIKFKKPRSNPIVVIQSNNLFDIPDHINCVNSIGHMVKKFPMSEILYSGEIELKGYKRFMLIGRV